MSKVLAADDSEPIRRLVALVLSTAGHTVHLARDGKEALDLFAAGGFDLVVTDINMPAMNGLQLINHIRVLDADIPILALTTESSVQKRQLGQQAGANGWIVKPFKAPQFLDIVKQISG